MIDRNLLVIIAAVTLLVGILLLPEPAALERAGLSILWRQGMPCHYGFCSNALGDGSSLFCGHVSNSRSPGAPTADLELLGSGSSWVW